MIVGPLFAVLAFCFLFEQPARIVAVARMPVVHAARGMPVFVRLAILARRADVGSPIVAHVVTHGFILSCRILR